MLQKREIATCIILSIVTCGIYGIYLYYKIGQLTYDAKRRFGVFPAEDQSVLYLVLAIVASLFGFGGVILFVICSIVQTDLNNILIPNYQSWQYSYVVEESSEPPSNI